MSETITWAIVDTAAEPDFFPVLEELDPPHASLYADPVPDEIGRLAPYLVQVNEDIRHWLLNRETPWGIFLESRVSLKELRQHLRKYLHVQIPDEEKPVFFRFYDPRNIWSLLSVLSPWEQHSFLGPVEAIETAWKGGSRHERFTSLHEQFHPGGTSRRKIMRISHEQMEQLTIIFEQRYIDGLVERIDGWRGGEKQTDPQVIAETFRWLKLQGITDDRSIRGLFRLFYERECLALKLIPVGFSATLTQEGETGAYKAETLLIRELGSVPL